MIVVSLVEKDVLAVTSLRKLRWKELPLNSRTFPEAPKLHPTNSANGSDGESSDGPENNKGVNPPEGRQKAQEHRPC